MGKPRGGISTARPRNDTGVTCAYTSARTIEPSYRAAESEAILTNYRSSCPLTSYPEIPK